MGLLLFCLHSPPLGQFRDLQHACTYLFFNFLMFSASLLFLQSPPPYSMAAWYQVSDLHLNSCSTLNSLLTLWSTAGLPGRILLNSEKVSLDVYLISLLIFFLISETENPQERTLICLLSLVTPLELSKISTHTSFLNWQGEGTHSYTLKRKASCIIKFDSWDLHGKRREPVPTN